VSRSELDGCLRIFSEDALDPFRGQMAAVCDTFDPAEANGATRAHSCC
jgi:hypothetical protein